MKNFVFSSSVINDLQLWTKSNPKLVKKVFELLIDIDRNPFQGLGKPEALKHNLKGF